MTYQKQLSDNDLKSGITDFLKTAADIYMPGVSVDTVIFGLHNDALKILLLRFGNTPYFVLPGGFIRKEEDLDAAALRILQERTGLQNIYLEQFYTSGSINRLQAPTKELFQKVIGRLPRKNWLQQR